MAPHSSATLVEAEEAGVLRTRRHATNGVTTEGASLPEPIGEEALPREHAHRGEGDDGTLPWRSLGRRRALLRSVQHGGGQRKSEGGEPGLGCSTSCREMPGRRVQVEDVHWVVKT